MSHNEFARIKCGACHLINHPDQDRTWLSWYHLINASLLAAAALFQVMLMR